MAGSVEGTDMDQMHIKGSGTCFQSVQVSVSIS